MNDGAVEEFKFVFFMSSLSAQQMKHSRNKSYFHACMQMNSCTCFTIHIIQFIIH